VPPPDINASGPFSNLGGSLGYSDTNTGLIWQSGDGGYLCWSADYCSGVQAVEYCQNLMADGVTVAGSAQNVWRLPTVRELQSTVDYNLVSPATTLPNTQSGDYWSSTTGADGSVSAWIVSMYYGDVGGDDKGLGYNLARCVR